MAGNHGGNLRELAAAAGIPEDELLDFSASINPLGPPGWLRSVLARGVSRLVHYPDPDAAAFTTAAAEAFGVPENRVLPGNGSTELLYGITRVAGVRRAVIPVPSYGDYTTSCELAGLDVHFLHLQDDQDFRLDLSLLEEEIRKDGSSTIVFLGNPNNPTGLTTDHEELRRLCSRMDRVLFCIDEAFADFIPGYTSSCSWEFSNVITFRSYTKFYAIPGLRLGVMIGPPEYVRILKRHLPGWSVNTFSQMAGVRAVRDKRYGNLTREYVARRREELKEGLKSTGMFKVYPGAANYLFLKVYHPDLKGGELAEYLLTRGIAVRRCETFQGLDDRFLRIAVRKKGENDRLLLEVEGYIGSKLPGRKSRNPVLQKRKRPALMFQGTSSNAGKSILAAAMCRVLLQDGFRVAPFKAQNMALNSFVTHEGGEMGRAQVVQAQACRLEPEVRMNPVLLKPSSDTGSQVILLGKPVENMEAVTYHRYKDHVLKKVRETYDDLASDFEVMVLEGAGSPGEVNLKDHDIVNMNMAEYAGAKVLIVGDIDRGGVFASLVGIMEVLYEWERDLVAGFILNKFRGDETLLRPAYRYVEEYTGKQFYGTLPYIHDLGLPEEDSVTFKERSHGEREEQEGAALTIALVDIPHISNFTDVDPLRIEPDVNLVCVRRPEDLENIPSVDAVILPGSKNVIADMNVLVKTGISRILGDVARSGTTEIIGICGGFQMLGRRVSDPYHIESAEESVNGFGLLDLDTVLERDKVLTRKEVLHVMSGLPVTGYEIHHGKTRAGEGCVALFQDSGGDLIGAGHRDIPVWGTYLHGIFDNDAFRRWFLDSLRSKKGLDPLGRIVAPYDIDGALDRLAEEFRKAARIKDLYSLLGLS